MPDIRTIGFFVSSFWIISYVMQSFWATGLNSATTSHSVGRIGETQKNLVFRTAQNITQTSISLSTDPIIKFCPPILVILMSWDFFGSIFIWYCYVWRAFFLLYFLNCAIHCPVFKLKSSYIANFVFWSCLFFWIKLRHFFESKRCAIGIGTSYREKVVSTPISAPKNSTSFLPETK